MRRYAIVVTLVVWFASVVLCYGGSYEEARRAYDDGLYEVAYKTFKELATEGHAKAQSELSFMYASGTGVKQDYNEAYKWAKKAAQQDDVTAQHNLGFMYDAGIGVKQDKKEALAWYLKAAKNGYSHAQMQLFYLYTSGKGVVVDYKEGLRWLKRAAESGNPDATSAMSELVDDRWLDLGGAHIDLMTITKEPDGTISYWIKNNNNPDGKYNKVKSKINCSTGKVYLLSYVQYNKDGSLLKVSNGNQFITDNIPPGTLFEAEKDVVCK